MVSECVYILSIVLQVTGAGLVSFYWYRNKDVIFKEEYFKMFCTFLVEVDKKENIKVEPDKVTNTLEKIWINRISFFIIALGYLISVFGTNMDNVFLAGILVVFVSLFLGSVLYKVVKIMVKKDSENKEYHKMILDDVPVGSYVIKRTQLQDKEG